MYVVIVNAPGYMPNQEPVECATYCEAQQALCAEFWTTVQELDPDGEHACADDIYAMEREVLASPEGEHVWQLMGLAHYIQRV